HARAMAQARERRDCARAHCGDLDRVAVVVGQAHAVHDEKRTGGPWPPVRDSGARGYSPPTASCRGSAAPAFCLAVSSSPVAWSPTFIDRRTLPRSSKPRSLTFTLPPSFPTSVPFCPRRGASWLMCTRPSLAPKKFTKAPKSITLTTVPS